MEMWLIWISAGIIMVLLEFIVPGGIIVFLGTAALFVGASVYFGVITSVVSALIAWFISSIFLMLFLRSVFIKYFEGDSQIQNVDEDEDLKGSVVTVVEDVFPYKEGRVKFRDSTWVARSEEEILKENKAIIVNRDGNVLVVKPL